jgi:putative hemolysin
MLMKISIRSVREFHSQLVVLALAMITSACGGNSSGQQGTITAGGATSSEGGSENGGSENGGSENGGTVGTSDGPLSGSGGQAVSTGGVSTDVGGVEAKGGTAGTSSTGVVAELVGEVCDYLVVTDSGSGNCGDGSGLVKDTKIGLTWMRNTYQPAVGLTWGEATAYCQQKGMRLPTYKQALSIAGTNRNTCAFPCTWDIWTASAATGGTSYPTSTSSDGGWTQYLKLPTKTLAVLCVSGELTSWAEHDGLYWSPLSTWTGIWKEAYNYCTELGGELPTITELRTLVKNCQQTGTGGTCPELITDNIQADGSYGGLIPGCEGCDKATDGRYSEFGDIDIVWSATEADGNYDNKLKLVFSTGGISARPAYNVSESSNYLPVRCVRRTASGG